MKKLIFLMLTILIIACSSSDDIEDSTAPVIMLLGETYVHNFQHFNYIDDGATATDNVDGDLTSNIVTVGSVNTAFIGTYIITYSVSDAAGNTTTASRHVEVTDSPIYLDENGITIKAKEWAKVGDSGIVNSVTYKIVNRSKLNSMVINGDDMTKIVTTKVTIMKGLFKYAYAFNQDISSWDVSNVNDMRDVFRHANAFNQDISSWDMSNVSKMNWMFKNAYAFNQDISSWDVSNVNDMREMFWDASVFNQDLSSWNVNGVTQCIYFYNEAQWILPKPNFTNCTF